MNENRMNECECIVCKQTIPKICARIVCVHGDICMNHENKKIEVYKIDCDGSFYYECNLDHVMELLKEIDIHEAYTITKEKMSVQVYYDLPEFQGF